MITALTPFVICVSLATISCSKAESHPQRPESTRASSTNLKGSLYDIDLSKIGHITPKGRVQDNDYHQLKVVEQLIAHGKESIPFLVAKLEDETEIEGHVMDYWNQVYVGDVALIILSDFFLSRNWEKSTIEGMKWDDFLERGNDKDITGEQLLRNYVERYGRKRIKERWQKVWENYQQRIVWDERERCFKVV